MLSSRSRKRRDIWRRCLTHLPQSPWPRQGRNCQEQLEQRLGGKPRQNWLLHWDRDIIIGQRPCQSKLSWWTGCLPLQVRYPPWWLWLGVWQELRMESSSNRGGGAGGRGCCGRDCRCWTAHWLTFLLWWWWWSKEEKRQWEQTLLNKINKGNVNIICRFDNKDTVL